MATPEDKVFGSPTPVFPNLGHKEDWDGRSYLGSQAGSQDSRIAELVLDEIKAGREKQAEEAKADREWFAEEAKADRLRMEATLESIIESKPAKSDLSIFQFKGSIDTPSLTTTTMTWRDTC